MLLFLRAFLPFHAATAAYGVRPKASHIARLDPVAEPGRSMQGMASERQSRVTVLTEHLIEHRNKRGGFCEQPRALIRIVDRSIASDLRAVANQII